MKADRELRKTADHEAAHALVGWIAGQRIESITVDPRRAGDSQGVCYLSGGRIGVIGEPKSLTADQAHFLLAGRTSDDLFHPGGRPGHGQDFRNLEDLLPLNDETLKMHAFPHGEKSIEDFYQMFRGPVVKLLRSRRGRRAHRALSAALMEDQTLSGQHAAEILQGAWGDPLPPRALPREDHCGIIDKRPANHGELFRTIRGLAGLALADCEAMQGRGTMKEIQQRQRAEHLLHLLLVVVGKTGAAPQGDGRVLPKS
ncbi:MAG: hypothetical protein HPY65_00765 [Syntrophaceae bacterium]|nr:hypothetical protein [Syntrophaceae bacterium]